MTVRLVPGRWINERIESANEYTGRLMIAYRSALRRSSLVSAVLFALAATLSFAGCVQVQCQLNSDCPEHSSCVMNACISSCGADRDCPAATPFCNLNGRCVALAPDGGTMDAALDAHDGGVDVRDTTMPPIDNPPPVDVPTPVDNFVPTDNPPPPDVPTTTPRGYLDSCSTNTDCASGLCTTNSPQFCTRTCSVHSDCAYGQMCAGGTCQLADTGTPGCNPSTGAPCLQYCYGSGTAAHCTRDCSSPSDCPAGYACSPVGTRHVCVQIEIPCTAPTQCPSGLGFCGAGMAGCTANCTTAADCPQRLSGLPPYTCVSQGGQMVCMPPSDVMGSDPLGTTCSATSTTNTCRSDICTNSTTPAACNEVCSPNGGCGPGYGCYPDTDGTNYYLLCHASGRAWVNQSCSRAADCYSGLCDSSGFYCSRLCNDGLCPTGMTCVNTGAVTVDGAQIRLCRRG